jgi:hypothetical protein
MFAFDRSAVAVLAPLAILVAVVLWSNLDYSSAEIHASCISLARVAQRSPASRCVDCAFLTSDVPVSEIGDRQEDCRSSQRDQ